jgi:hypothetical protein
VTEYLVSGLNTGSTYVFKVEAQNAYSYSEVSNLLTVLAATIPLQVDEPTTSVSAGDIIVTWTAPYNSGSPITAYKVMFKHSDGVNYS